MYEKCNELDKSLNDILVVLTMDPHHLKARIRRGRIYEAQVRVSLTSLS
jgi:deoxyadenosine/deoxycytidine kinase